MSDHAHCRQCGDLLDDPDANVCVDCAREPMCPWCNKTLASDPVELCRDGFYRHTVCIEEIDLLDSFDRQYDAWRDAGVGGAA